MTMATAVPTHLTLEERFKLRDKVAVVVGANGHLCSSLSRALADAGMHVVSLDVRNNHRNP